MSVEGCGIDVLLHLVGVLGMRCGLYWLLLAAWLLAACQSDCGTVAVQQKQEQQPP